MFRKNSDSTVGAHLKLIQSQQAAVLVVKLLLFKFKF